MYRSHQVEIFIAIIMRTKRHPDKVYLNASGFVDPLDEAAPLSLRFETPRGKAEEVIEGFWPGLETRLLESERR